MKLGEQFRSTEGYALLVVSAALAAVGVFGISMYVASQADYSAAKNLAKKTKTHLEAAGVIAAVSQDLRNGYDGDSLAQVESAYSLSTASNCPSDNSALVHWPFDEGEGSVAGDSSGNGNDGAIYGAAWDSAGYCGQALLFDGNTGDNVLDDDGELYINGLDQITVCVWVKSNQIDTDKGFLFGLDAGGGDNTFEMRYDASGWAGGGNDVIKLVLETTGGGTQYESASNVQTTDWQHLAMSWKSGEALKLYIDGNLDSPTEAGSALSGTISTVQQLLVGQAGKDGSSSGWDGMIDDFRIYGTALTQEEIATVMGGGSLGSGGGEMGATLKWGLVSGDTVEYVVDQQASGYTIEATGATAVGSYGSELSRMLSFEIEETAPVQDTSIRRPFESVFVINSDIFFGKFNDEWSGAIPMFVGDIMTAGEIYMDDITEYTTNTDYIADYIVYFGYDLDGNDSIEVMGDSGQETCHLFSASGQLLCRGGSAGSDDINDVFDIFVNKPPSGGVSPGYTNYAVEEEAGNTSSPKKYHVDVTPGLYFDIQDGDNDGTIEMTEFMDFMEDTVGVHFKDSALDGGYVISDVVTGADMTGADGSTMFDESNGRWFFDWNANKKVLLWDIDMGALKSVTDAMADFNGYVYIERDVTGIDNDYQFAGVRLSNFEQSPGADLTDTAGGTYQGLTIVTPHPLYTQGCVNIDPWSDPVDLCMISYAHTVLSASWIDSLCRWDIGNAAEEGSITEQEFAVTLHNQASVDLYTGVHKIRGFTRESAEHAPDCPGNYCHQEWIVDLDDGVTNWFFRYGNANQSPNGSPYRREPRNNSVPGVAWSEAPSATNGWWHGTTAGYPDNTVVKGIIITGFSLPTEYRPATSEPEGSCSGINLVNSTNTQTYDLDKSRFGDGIHFLEAWVGRYGSGTDWDNWDHELHLYGAVNLLWECTETPFIYWSTTLEGCRGITMRPPLATNNDWLEETCNGDFTCTRQVKIGSCAPPRLKHFHTAMNPPGFVPVSSETTTPGEGEDATMRDKLGTWRRDYGYID